MSREIDDRIVAMHFQNEEFERKARKTLNTLDELQQKLDLEGAADSFSAVTKATSKQLGLKETTKEAKDFSSAIKSAGEMGKKAITSLTSPIRNTMGLLSDLRRYAGIALGFDIGNKLVSTAENMMRTFTVQPVSAGWSEYELKMDSIKTIMTGTKNEFVKAAEAAGKAYDEATHLASVKDALEDLNKYSDDTIYSFKDMTSNIGKFVNNGVKLDKAVLAMRGISNAAALAGQGTNQASMAMYNLAQAISVGKLTTMDWKSIENANMATLEMKQAILDTAAAAGKLEKIDGKLYIAEKDFYQGKKVSEQQRKKDLEKRLVTAENFRNMLHYGFADSNVITNVLEIFSGAEELTEYRLREMGFTDDEEIKRMIELGKAAFQAATEVRTFSKMMDALKEAAQSGWAVSFELIFGDMNEATDLWSTLNEKLSGILQKSADNRNNMLRRWRGMTYDKDLKEWVRDPNKQDGRQILIESFDRLFTSITQVTGAIARAKNEIFGSFTSGTLMNITKWIEKISKAFQDWLNADHQKNLKKLTSIFKGFFTVIKIVWNTAKKVIGFLSTALKPVLSFLFDTFAAIGQWLSQFKDLTIGEAIGKIVDWFKKLTREKVADWFIKLGDSVKKVFGDIWTAVSGWLKDNGLGGVVTFFEGIYHDFETAWNWFSTLPIWDTIGAFLGDAWTWIKEKAGVVGKALVDAWDFMTSKETIDSITYFVTSAKETVEKTLTAAWNAISNWSGWKTIGGFLINVWGWIKEQAGVVGSTVSEVWNNLTSEETINNIRSFIATTWASFVTIIRNGWNAISNWTGWETIGGFLANVWGWIKEQAGIVGTTVTEAWNNLTSEETINNIGSFISNTWSTFVSVIRNSWDAIKKWPGWETIGGFLVNVWGWIKEQAGVVGSTVSEVWNNLTSEETINNIRSFIATTWASFVTIIRNGWNAISNWPGWETIGGFLVNVWGWIKEQARAAYSVLSSAISFATSEETIQNISSFVESAYHVFCEVVDKAWTAISGWSGWKTIGGFLINVWDWILKQIGYTGDAEEAAKDADDLNGETATQAGAAVSEALDKNSNAIQVISNAATNVMGATNELVKSAENSDVWQIVGDVLSSIWGILTSLFETVAGVVIGEDTLRDIQTILGNTKDIIIEILKFVTDYGAKVVGAKPMDDNAWLTSIIALIGAIATVWLRVKKFNSLKGLKGFKNVVINSDSFGTTLLKFAGAIALIAYAIMKISEVSDGVFWTGAGRIAGIAIALAAVLVALKGVGNAGAESNPVTKGERVLETLIKWVAIAGIIWIVFDKLPAVIAAMKDAHIEKGMFVDLALGITVLLLGMMVVSKALSGVGKIGPEGIVDIIIGIVTLGIALVAAFIAIGGVIILMANAYDANLNPENLKKARQVMEGIGAFFGALVGGFQGAVEGATGAQKMQAMGDSVDDIKEASDKMETLNTKGFDNFKTTMAALEELQKAMPKNPERLLGIIQFFTGEQSFRQFTDQLPDIADKLADVATRSLGIDQSGIDNFARAMTIFTKLQEALPPDPSRLNNFYKFFHGEQNLAEFSAQFPAMAEHFSKMREEFANVAEQQGIPVAELISDINGAADVISKLVGLAALVSDYSSADTEFSMGTLYTFFADLFNSDQYQQIQYKDYYDYIHGLSEKYYNLTDEEIRGLTSEPAFQTALGNLGYMAQAIADGINLAIGAASLDINAEPLFTAMAESFSAESAAKIMASGFSKMLDKIGWTTIYDELDEDNPVYQMADSFNRIFEKVAETGKITAMPIIQAMVDSMMNEDSITLMKQGLQALVGLADAGEFNITDLLGLGNLTSGLGDLTGILGNSELTEMLKNLASGNIEIGTFSEDKLKELAGALNISTENLDIEGLQTKIQGVIDNLDTSKLENITYVPVIAAGPNGETFSFLEDGSLTISGTVGINSSDIQSVTTAVNQNMMAIGNVAMRTAETRDAVNSLANTVARLEDDILRMRVMLYPNIIAGYIDKYQYNQLMRP